MKKLDLLHLANLYAYSDAQAIVLAQSVLSNETAALQVSALEARCTRRSRLESRWWCAAACGGLLVAELVRKMLPPEVLSLSAGAVEAWAWTLLVGTFSAVGVFFVAQMLAARIKDYSASVGPLRVVTDMKTKLAIRRCLEKGGPFVTEWYRLALGERQQLLRLDYEVMRSLAYAYRAYATGTLASFPCRPLRELAPGT